MTRMRRNNFQHGARRIGGFTAIEISAVAAIIAILTLILVPIMRNQVAKSKIVAAQDDMFSIAKAEEIAFAELGFIFRPHDLMLGIDDPNTAELESPRYQWDQPLPLNLQAQFATTWGGPYLVMNRSAPLIQLVGFSPWLFRSADNSGGLGGPILIEQRDIEPDASGAYPEYPIDPWGNPYILFGQGYRPDQFGQNGRQISEYGDPAISSREETMFHSSGVIYSLGPDGVPGDRTVANPVNPTDPASYFRGVPNGLGTGDDLSRNF